MWKELGRIVAGFPCPLLGVKDLANLLDHAKVRFSESEGMCSVPTCPSYFAWMMYRREGGRTVKCLMKQLLEGMEYLHRHDIIHRFVHNPRSTWLVVPTNITTTSDIKMSNLLLTRTGILKLGLSLLLSPPPS